jgi:diguanylate cyclase (GGDEF)-like protein
VLGHAVVAMLLDGGHLRVAGRSPSAPPELPLGLTYETDGSLAGLSMQSDDVVQVADAQTDTRARPGTAALGLRSVVTVPLRHSAVPLGAVGMVSREPDAFTREDADVLALLAFSAAAAMVASSIQNDMATEQLRTSAAFGLTKTGLWRWDAVSDELQWSPEMYELTGLDPETTTPTIELWESLLHPEDRCRGDLVGCVGSSPGGHVETVRLRRADGSWRELVAWSRLMHDGDGDDVTGVFGATVDVTPQRYAEAELARMAARDGLTGLANRSMLDQLTERCLETLPQPDADDAVSHLAGDVAADLPDGLGPLTALLLLDLDRFKLVNDTLGHTAGDALLMAVADRLTSALEVHDVSDCSPTVARLGGDEFVVLLPWVAGVEAACDVARWLLDVVREPVEVDGTSIVCTGSIGVSVASHSQRSPEELFREADLAMYRAKSAGRDRMALYDSDLRAQAESRLGTEQRLRSAIERGRLLAVFQPLVRLDGERVVGAEALVRLVDDDGQLVLPEGFIDVAEDTRLIVAIDRWMLRQGVDRLAEWAELGHRDLRMQVNASALTLSQPDFHRYVLEVLRERDVDPSSLRIELTETSLLPGGSDVLDTMRRLAAEGVETGIDDFGTGYSTLAYLQDLPIGFIKIDRAFVSRLDGSPRPSAVVRAVVELAHAHGYQVTAEGVENALQAELLRDMGCDHAQGWLFGRPETDGVLARASWSSSRTLT